MRRLIRHLTTRWHVRQAFDRKVLDRIEAAIRAVEALHAGELRMAIDAALDLEDVLSRVTARARAVEVFKSLQVWDTEHNNGVLIYILYADRAIEIVADRGYNHHVSADEWRAVCAAGEREFRSGRFADGAVELVNQVGRLIARHFPPRGDDLNELPDRPALL